MAQRIVGLDIGTHAVRAAELTFGRGGSDPTLTRFAQVALPLGAVVDGEVVDPGLVATSLRRLWTAASRAAASSSAWATSASSSARRTSRR
jgi:type IV pilus assembly protein PilM